jgi:hypothetical protein
MNVLALLLLAAQGTPAPSGVSFDMQCMIASQLASEQLEGAEKFATTLAAMFYFGRVDSVVADAELERRLEIEAKTIGGRPLGPILEQCGEFMKSRGETMQQIGLRLEEKERREGVN